MAQSTADPFDLLDGITIDDVADTTYALTSKKDYHKLMRYQNVTSNSIQLDLHKCPRFLQLKRYYAGRDDDEENMHFAFGHAVGAGVQNLLATKNVDLARFNGWLAWNADFYSRLTKKKKSIWEADIAVEKFVPFIEEQLEDWELLFIDGKPAIETSFSLDCNNGYKHYGHIDAILKHKRTGHIAVLELKTSGFTSPEEALYANSSQALGYSIILDSLFPGITTYEVFHFIYSSTSREWTPMPFTKTVSHKAEWIKDLLLDHAMLDKYEELKFYPKRGESCYSFFQRCKFFGACNIVPDTELPRLGMEEAAELVDFELNLADIVKAQQDKLATSPVRYR